MVLHCWAVLARADGKLAAMMMARSADCSEENAQQCSTIDYCVEPQS